MAVDTPSTPFQSARLTYRAVEDDDEAFVHELEADPASFINSQTGIKRPQAKRDSKKHFDWLVNDCLLAVVICVTAEDCKPIGVINLNPLPSNHAHHRHSEIGLGLLPSRQGKGYGSEAIAWVLQWAFESAGLHRVAVNAFEYNYGARRLYEKLGFTHEGTIRELWWHDGRFWGDFLFGMLESEWRARRDQGAE